MGKIYYIKIGFDKASGIFDDGKMTVLKGSVISNKPMLSTFRQADKRRALIKDNTIEQDGKYILAHDLAFNTPSAAAVFCLGQNSNGWVLWKDESGVTLEKSERREED